jgi:hypothetical protein
MAEDGGLGHAEQRERNLEQQAPVGSELESGQAQLDSAVLPRIDPAQARLMLLNNTNLAGAQRRAIVQSVAHYYGNKMVERLIRSLKAGSRPSPTLVNSLEQTQVSASPTEDEQLTRLKRQHSAKPTTGEEDDEAESDLVGLASGGDAGNDGTGEGEGASEESIAGGNDTSIDTSASTGVGTGATNENDVQAGRLR